MKFKENHVDGVCCACGDDSEQEGADCPKTSDTHCNHWWYGEEIDCIVGEAKP